MMKDISLEWRNEPKTDRIWGIVGIVYAGVFAAIIMYMNRNFYSDDAYITLRYARNYIDGLGIVWNPGEYVQGYTNFLHLLLISLLGRLGIDFVLASRIVGISALGGLLAIVPLFRATVKNEHCALVWRLPVILVLTSVPMLVWTLGGLEGTLFSFLVTGGSLLFLVAIDSSTRLWLFSASGLLFGLSFLARPDGVIFLFISLVWLCWMAWKHKSQASFHLLAYFVGTVIVVAPYVFWQVFYYGDIVPNTFYAKTGAALWVRLCSGLPYVLDYLVRPPFLPVLVLISLVYGFVLGCWSAKLTYLALAVSTYIIFIIFVGGDYMPAFRLLLPVIPLMSVMLAMALSSATGSHGNVIVNRMTLAILVVTTLQLQDKNLNLRSEDPPAFAGIIIGKYIATAWPVGSLVALNTAGSTPYYARQHRYIDMLGLNDSSIAKRTIEKIELPWQRVPGHFKGDGAYVLSRHPNFIIVGPAQGVLASHPVFLSDLELNRDPRFARDYALVQIELDDSGHPTIGDGLTFTYYKRRDGQDGIQTVQPPLAADNATYHR